MPENENRERFDGYHEQGSRGLLASVWRRKALVLVCLGASLTIGLLYYAQKTPVYLATAKIHVVRKQSLPSSLIGGDPRTAFFDDYLATHQELIKSPLIVQEAIKKAGLKQSTPAVMDGLKITREKDSTGLYTPILILAYRSNSAQDCVPVLEALIESYKEYLDVTYKNVSDNTLKLITQAKTEMEENLARKEKKYDEYRKQFSKASAVFVRRKEGERDPLSVILAQRSALMMREAEIKGFVKAIERAKSEKKERSELLAMVSSFRRRLANDSRLTLDGNTKGGDERLLALSVQEDELLQIYGPDHPAVKSLRKRMERTRQYLSSLGTTDSDGSERGKPPQDTVEAFLAALVGELQEIKVTRDSLTELIRTEYGDPDQLAEFESMDSRFRRDIARSEEFLNSIAKHLNEIDIVRDIGGYDAQTIYPPSASDVNKIEPRLSPILLGSVFFGLLTGLCLAYLAEVTDKSFRSPEDIRARMGVAVIGHIPFMKATTSTKVGPDGAKVYPTLCTLTQPRSPEAEAYRGVRTSLFFSTRNLDHRVIQITSPYKGDGKSTLSANLAISIAQVNKKVLLIEADFRRPSLHKIFGLTPESGLASVIAGNAELLDAIRETQVPGLSVMMCGPIPRNPAELLSSPRFQEVLEALRDKYDFVLVDTPPLLAVTDPCVVTPRSDGVLLTIRIFKNGRPGAERCREILTTLGANLLGVVVNGVGGKGQGYGYGYSHYSYNYGYGHGYTHGYEHEPERKSRITMKGSDPVPAEFQDPAAGNGTETAPASDAASIGDSIMGFFRSLRWW
jgi:capsular exopolysaccharide synthesis family protein